MFASNIRLNDVLKMSTKNMIFAVLIISCFVDYNLLVNGCYITNCPWGGKRSLSDSYSDGETRQCNSCAGGMGTCFGPRTCCGPEIGCLIDTKESLTCRAEDTKSSLPCIPYGKACDKVEFGKCATKHLCCNPLACVHDSSCSVEDEIDVGQLDDQNVESSRPVDKKLIKLLSLLLKKKQSKNVDQEAN